MASMSPVLPIHAPTQAPSDPEPERKAMRKIAMAAVVVGGGGVVNFPVGQLPKDPPVLKWLSKSYAAASFTSFGIGLGLLAVTSMFSAIAGGAWRRQVAKKVKWVVLAMVILVVSLRASMVLVV